MKEILSDQAEHIARGFSPILGQRPRVLILGSMPGQASLEANQYYAHPRNAFWPIMAALFAIDGQQSYESRARQLTEKGVAVWDVLKACIRPGSLDSAIAESTIVVNDFSRLFRDFPEIRLVAFNGQAAARYWHKYVMPEQAVPSALRTAVLPSSSPAHASLNLIQKQQRWREVLLS
ncbi:DNA-deoxyinosine glycosylase [Pseudohongiella nitratireducens]|uniref:DNA-deoxyinosine glycosylase n=1 Tax=Pseudohongiella nitratireducens TaxID=1768907 RepID=A0A916QM19_9GAMM|nr:DNA-deoxyinosine glycosylase [Pseudohongiella nitratireducens]MDF1624217.1 DNA-deoxyinosine glycosylase [Pseudohongiella nitratireducens]GFZ79844.1 DNA-deoxyinosine glycosylase [Pseudohongiella nitratireducens]